MDRTLDHVLIYENLDLRQKTLSLVPVERFKKDAATKFNAYKSSSSATELKPYNMRDFVLLELLAWFKNEFFKWVDQPDCASCGNKEKIKFKTNSSATAAEAVWMAGNVEVYQ